MASFQIFVRDDCHGKTVVINANPSSPVSAVKSQLQAKLAIPWEYQRLVFQGRALKDESTLDSYGVVRNSTLHLMAAPPRRWQPVEVFNDSTGKQITLKIDPTFTVQTLKSMIRKSQGMREKDQQLEFLQRPWDPELADNAMIEHCGDWEQGFRLRDRRLGLAIFNEAAQTCIRFLAYTSHTVQCLNIKIRQHANIPVESQCLKLAGKTLSLPDNVGDYMDSDTAEGPIRLHDLRHYLPLDIWDEASQATLKVQAYSADTIFDLKKRLHESEGLSVEDQHLFLVGRELKDDRTLQSYGIFSTACGYVRLVQSTYVLPVKVFVRRVCVARGTIEAEPGNTLMAVKNKIHESLGVPVDLQNVFVVSKPQLKADIRSSAGIKAGTNDADYCRGVMVSDGKAAICRMEMALQLGFGVRVGSAADIGRPAAMAEAMAGQAAKESSEDATGSQDAEPVIHILLQVQKGARVTCVTIAPSHTVQWLKAQVAALPSLCAHPVLTLRCGEPLTFHLILTRSGTLLLVPLLKLTQPTHPAHLNSTQAYQHCDRYSRRARARTPGRNRGVWWRTTEWSCACVARRPHLLRPFAVLFSRPQVARQPWGRPMSAEFPVDSPPTGPHAAGGWKGKACKMNKHASPLSL